MAKTKKNKKATMSKEVDSYQLLLNTKANVIEFTNPNAFAYVFECDGKCENCKCKKTSLWQRVKALFNRKK